MAETVSVVIAVCNGEKYLGESIESVLAQTMPPDEVIVVDDGSSDGSAALARSFGGVVRVVSQDNAGQAAGLTRGAALATGTCLAFNDADDLWMPQKQEWQLAALAADPGLELVYGLCEQFVSPELDEADQRRYATPAAILPGALLQAALVRRTAYDRVGGINPTLRGAGATDWMGRSAGTGLTRLMLPDVILRRRLHANNYSRTHAAERDKNLLAVLRRQIDRRRKAAQRSNERRLMSKLTDLAPYTLVDEAGSLVLRAISHTGPEAVDAYRRWRALTTLDNAGRAASRVLPLFVDLVQREGLNDSELQRMQGVGRHIWTQNTLNVRILLAALDALATDGIQPMLLKGLALFVRSPEFMRKRASTDGDILVRPAELERSAALLRERGFEPKGQRWEDFSTPLMESVTSGTSLGQPGQRSHLDLHWRPLSNIMNPALGEAIFARAEQRELQGRTIFLPSLADQLFLALARCEPWDTDEGLTRLVEAQLLLSIGGQDIDWSTLAELVGRYGLEATGCAFLADLERYAGVAIPTGFLARLEQAVSADKLREWNIRGVALGLRSEEQRWHLQAMDDRSGRDHGLLGLANRTEIRLRRFGLNIATGGMLWRQLRQRVRPGRADDVRYLEGFSYPEADGRWSTGHWSALAVPLDEKQQAGEPVRLNVHAFRTGLDRLRIVATGGCETLSRIHARADADSDLELQLRVRPLPELGGGGLILLWVPDARTPASVGGSNDRRELGLFIRRAWQLPARIAGTRAPAHVGRLREIYRHLPIPMAIRKRLSPALGSVRSRVVDDTEPRPR